MSLILKYYISTLFFSFLIHTVIIAQVKIDAEKPELNDNSLYGWSVSTLWDRAIVTAPNKMVDGVDSSGAAYSMILSGGRNPQLIIESIIAPEPKKGMKFGISSALGDIYNRDSNESYFYAAIGAENHPDSVSGIGAVFLYKMDYESNNWVLNLDSVLTGNDTKPGDNFAHTIQLIGYDKTLFISAPNADGENSNSGAVYVFEFDGQQWIQKQKLIADDGNSGDQFGYSITTEEYRDYIVIGAPNADGKEPNSGAVYVFEKEDSTWVQTLKVTDPDGESGDQFGYSTTHLQEIAIPLKIALYTHTNYRPVFIGAPKKQQNGSVFYYINNPEVEDYKPFDVSIEIKQDSLLAFRNFGKSIAANVVNGLFVAADSSDGAGRIYQFNTPNIWNWYNTGNIESEIFLESNKESDQDYSNSKVFSTSLNPMIAIGTPYSSYDFLPNTGDVEFYYTILTSIEETQNIQKKITLNQNYPNPFNPTTVISFQLPQLSNIELKIYDILGKEVATLANSVLSAGNHQYSFDASGLTSGVYFYQLKTNSNTFIKKMMLIK